MAKKYELRFSGTSVEVSKQMETQLVYRIPYKNIVQKISDFEITNRFIVYILFGKNPSGKDFVYVEKSKNGLLNRPSAHEDKYKAWEFCFVITQLNERTNLNDASIQYIEDKINHRINSLNTYLNTTQVTTSETVNLSEKEVCDEFLEKILPMLYFLGLDLFKKEENLTVGNPKEESDGGPDGGEIPDGYYFLKRKLKKWNNQLCSAKLLIKNGKFTLCKGSMISPFCDQGYPSSLTELRKNPELIKENELMKDIVFDSLSWAAAFVIGGSANGWREWKTEEGQPIDVFRLKTKES